MSPRTLHPSRLKMLGFLALSCAFVAIGLKMISDGFIIGWGSLLFFGLCALTFIVQLFPNASYLQIDKNGFTICALFRSHTYQRTEVSEFEVTRIGIVNRMVVFNFSESYRQQLAMRQIATATTGYEGGLPDSYGLSYRNLAALLNEYRSKSLQQIEDECQPH